MNENRSPRQVMSLSEWNAEDAARDAREAKRKPKTRAAMAQLWRTTRCEIRKRRSKSHVSAEDHRHAFRVRWSNIWSRLSAIGDPDHPDNPMALRGTPTASDEAQASRLIRLLTDAAKIAANPAFWDTDGITMKEVNASIDAALSRARTIPKKLKKTRIGSGKSQSGRRVYPGDDYTILSLSQCWYWLVRAWPPISNTNGNDNSGFARWATATLKSLAPSHPALKRQWGTKGAPISDALRRLRRDGHLA